MAPALALGGIAYLIGESTDQLGNHLSPAATGILQSAVGNLPELFVCIFALKAGLVTVVQASLIGSILGNALPVLGLAFMAGGWRHGILRFGGRTPRMIASLLILAVAALMLPTLAHELHLPASEHEQALSVVCALALLLVFAVLTRAMLRESERSLPAEAHARSHAWPLRRAVAVLWPAARRRPSSPMVRRCARARDRGARHQSGLRRPRGRRHRRQRGGARRGVQLAWRGKAERAVSVLLNSALQVAVALVPILVLLSYLLGGPAFTLVSRRSSRSRSSSPSSSSPSSPSTARPTWSTAPRCWAST